MLVSGSADILNQGNKMQAFFQSSLGVVVSSWGRGLLWFSHSFNFASSSPEKMSDESGRVNSTLEEKTTNKDT